MAPIDGVRIGNNTVTFLDAEDNFVGAVRTDQIESIDIGYNNSNNVATYSLIVTLLSGAVKKLVRRKRGPGRDIDIEKRLQEIAEEIAGAMDGL